MKLHHHILHHLFPTFNFLQKTKENFLNYSKDDLRVLLFHDIPVCHYSNFTKQINHISKNWNIISPNDFVKIIEKRKPLKGKNVLLTFDDGFLSQKMIAEKVLNPMGIKGLFFLVTDFLNINKIEEAQKFISKKIIPGLKEMHMEKDLSNLNWLDAEFLVKSGHSVGSHTKTHARLTKIFSEKILEDEIINSAEVLKSRLGMNSLDHFAYTFGDISSINSKVLNIAKKNFRYIYSGVRGSNSNINQPFIVYRDALSPDDTMSLVDAFLHGMADFVYYFDRKKLTKINK